MSDQFRRFRSALLQYRANLCESAIRIKSIEDELAAISSRLSRVLDEIDRSPAAAGRNDRVLGSPEDGKGK